MKIKSYILAATLLCTAILLCAATLLCTATRTLFAASDTSHTIKPAFTLFAFDNGTGRGRLPAEVQAKMLKDLGYAGIGYTGTNNIPEMLKALDANGLKMFSIYVHATISPKGPSYDAGLKEAIRQLHGRETLIWLTITGKAPDADTQAVQVVREIGELAEAAGLRVALYPHVGFFVARAEDSLRIAKKANRKNVGASFNLCHWLKVGDTKKMRQQLEQVLPHLFVVSINGADHQGSWDRLIQTLDRGEFDLYRFLKTLKELDYDGPIGLQCYNISGDTRENLTRSMAAWRKLMARLAPNSQPAK